MTLTQRLLHYEKLMRLDKPIGILLLLWPTLWALWIAGMGQPSAFPVWIFVLGTVLMRSAGCVMNDYADRNIDGHVERTRNRPLATGVVSSREALLLAGGLSLVAFLMILPLHRLVLWLSVVALFLAASYPSPSASWPSPGLSRHRLRFRHPHGLRRAAIRRTADRLVDAARQRLLGGGLRHRIRDGRSARRPKDRHQDLGHHLRTFRCCGGDAVTRSPSACSPGGPAGARGWPFYLGLCVAAGIALYHYTLIRDRDRQRCFKAFLHNNWLGGVIFVGLAADYLLHPVGVRFCRGGGCRLGFAIAGGLWCLRVGHGIRATIRRPGAGRVQGSLVDLGSFAVIGRSGATTFLWRQERWIKKRPAAAPVLAGALAPRSGGASKPPSRAQTSTRQFPPAAAAPGAAEGEATAGSASPLPAGRAVPLSRARHRHDSSPRRRPGSSALILAVLFWGALVGGDWPGLARRRPPFLWRQERWIKKRPAAAPALAGSSLHPRPAGRVETRPHGLRHRRDNSRRPRAALGAAEGKAAAGSASPLPAGCRRVASSGAASGTIRRPGEGRGPGPLIFIVWFWVPALGGDWPGLAPAGDHLSCGDKKDG